MTTPNRLLDRHGAAEHLATSARRVDALRRDGVIRAVRDGGTWKFRVVDLDDYINTLTVNA